MTEILYRLDRYLLWGAPYSRWIQISLFLLMLLGAVGVLPGQFFTAFVLAATLIAFTLLLRFWRQRDFIEFEPLEPPTLSPVPLEPSDKLPVSVSGLFEVEGKEQRFTWLSGFYRTFATREHALICHVPPSQFLLSNWINDDVGMWYVFVSNEKISEIVWGRLHFGSKEQLGVIIEYEELLPKKGRFSREKLVTYRVFIAAEEEGDAQRILADLLWDREVGRQIEALPTNGVVKSTSPDHSEA